MKKIITSTKGMFTKVTKNENAILLAEKLKKYIYEFIFGSESNSKEIKVFYSLRFIFFLFIFIHHSFNYNNLAIFCQPALGVSGFIILSGFLNGYIYMNKYIKFSFKEIIKFTIKRIKKFYPLHIIMLLITISYTSIFNCKDFASALDFLGKLIRNLLLIQSWWPTDYFNFNGVTWYLSMYVFLSFITIPLLILINRINKSKFGKCKLISLAIINLLLSFVLVYFVKVNKLNDEFWIYVFPPSRIFEYFIGMIFGSFFTNYSVKKTKFISKIFYTFLEIGAIFILYEFTFNLYKIPNTANIFHYRLNQYLIPIIILLSVFMTQKGYISKILSIRPLVYLGKISMYMFLIHQPLIILMGRNVVHYKYLCLWLLILTIILGSIANKYEENKEIVKMNKKQNEKNSKKTV